MFTREENKLFRKTGVKVNAKLRCGPDIVCLQHNRRSCYVACQSPASLTAFFFPTFAHKQSSFCLFANNVRVEVSGRAAEPTPV